MRFAWQFSVPPGKYRNRSSYHAMKVSFQVPYDLIFAWSGERWLDEAHEGWHSTRKRPITLSSLKRPISRVIKARSRCITNKTDKYYLNRSSEASDRRTTSYGTFKANSHMPCRAPAVHRECRVLRESSRGSRKKPNVADQPRAVS